MELKRVDVLSCAKVTGLLYACIGVLIGALLSLFAALGMATEYDADDATLGILFGVGAVIFIPIFYGVMGAVCAAIGAALYNLIARTVGGIHVELS